MEVNQVIPVIPLIGSAPQEKFSGGKLPNKKEVLCVFFHHHRTMGKTISEAVLRTVDELIPIWMAYSIPVIKAQNISKRIKEIFKQWQHLRKSTGRSESSSTQKKKEQGFKQNIEQLFDISLTNALELMEDEEHKRFLIQQREPGRQGMIPETKIEEARAAIASKRESEDRYGYKRHQGRGADVVKLELEDMKEENSGEGEYK